MNKKAMYNLTYGLFILTTKDGDKDNGCIVNTVIQVAVNKGNFTHDMILKTGEFNVSILSEQADFSTFQHWGFQSGATVDKTIGISYERAANQIIFLTNQTNAYISAKVISATDLGSHTLFLADVTDADTLSSDPSVTYTYYQNHIKPAPESSKKTGYVCTICGYIYDGDPLPEDFICPICKHPASDFKPL